MSPSNDLPDPNGPVAAIVRIRNGWPLTNPQNGFVVLSVMSAHTLPKDCGKRGKNTLGTDRQVGFTCLYWDYNLMMPDFDWYQASSPIVFDSIAVV